MTDDYASDHVAFDVTEPYTTSAYSILPSRDQLRGRLKFEPSSKSATTSSLICTEPTTCDLIWERGRGGELFACQLQTTTLLFLLLSAVYNTFRETPS